MQGTGEGVSQGAGEWGFGAVARVVEACGRRSAATSARGRRLGCGTARAYSRRVERRASGHQGRGKARRGTVAEASRMEVAEEGQRFGEDDEQ